MILIVLFLMSLTSCKVGPNYHRPQNFIADQWNAADTHFIYEAPSEAWWEIFNDSILNKYMQLAASYNNDVLAAEANIFQARALRQVSAAPLFPKLSADWDAFHIFLSKNGPIDAFAAAASAATPTPAPIPQKLNFFNNFIDASWELDIFGKTRRSVEASQAHLESMIGQKNEMLISVFAEIAKNYIELRSSQMQKILLESAIDILQSSVRLIQRRYTLGYSNLLELEQIEVQLNQALSELPAVNTTLYRSLFALSVLTGDQPEALKDELLPPQPLPELPECLAVGLRSDLLRRRPDIGIAERNLAQAMANIGVAVASFYPSFTLTGLMGVDSLKFRNLYASNSKTGLYGVDVNMPIFQGGKLIGNLRIAEAQTAALAFTYQQTLLNALQEAENALTAFGEEMKTLHALKTRVAANQRLSNLNKQRVSKGLSNRLDDLNSELILNNSELSLLQSETNALLDLVMLYKALGGGWAL